MIADFTWAGLWSVMITGRVLEAFRGAGLKGFEAGAVEMQEEPSLKKPVGSVKRNKPRIQLPYEGPRLYDLFVDLFIPVCMEKSTVQVTNTCVVCGRSGLQIEGVEEASFSTPIRIPRQPGKGMFVRSTDLGDRDFFHWKHADELVICTDRVKRAVEAERFDNIDFLEVGDVIDND